MIVEIMQSHVETGKWYLQHQPTHPRADALLGAVKDSTKINASLRSTARIEDDELVIGPHRYQIGLNLRYWRRLYHHRQGDVTGCGIKLYPPSKRGGKGKAEKLFRKSRRRRR